MSCGYHKPNGVPKLAWVECEHAVSEIRLVGVLRTLLQSLAPSIANSRTPCPHAPAGSAVSGSRPCVLVWSKGRAACEPVSARLLDSRLSLLATHQGMASVSFEQCVHSWA